MMDLLQRAVPAPQTEVAVHRTAWRQIFGDITPLAAGAQHIHHAVDDLAHVHRALAAAALGRRDQWLDQPPLRAGQVAWIAQRIAVIAMAVRGRPRRAPPASVSRDESHLSEPDQARSANRFK